MHPTPSGRELQNWEIPKIQNIPDKITLSDNVFSARFYFVIDSKRLKYILWLKKERNFTEEQAKAVKLNNFVSVWERLCAR